MCVSRCPDKPKSVELAIAVLEQAASKRDVPGPQVIKAMSTLEKAKLPVCVPTQAAPLVWHGYASSHSERCSQAALHYSCPIMAKTSARELVEGDSLLDLELHLSRDALHNLGIAACKCMHNWLIHC